MKHIYKLAVENNDDPAYHPLTVTVERHGEEREFSGKSLKKLIGNAAKYILEQEEE